MSTRFNLGPAKNPSDRLSGDQNTPSAPSVPATGRGCASDTARTHTREFPFGSYATMARLDPSGDSANGTVSTVSGNLVPIGGDTEKLTVATAGRVGSRR